MNDLQPQDPVSKVIEESAKIAERFLEKLAGPAIEEGGGLLKGQVKFWRFKNQINLLIKAKKFLEDKKLDPNKVLPKTAMSILENGSIEQDENLQEMWANLLASYATSNLDIQSYPHILKELSSMEVKLLTDLYASRLQSGLNGVDLLTHGETKEGICNGLKITAEQYDVMVDNLFRLNLIQPVGSAGALIGEYPISVKLNHIIHMTSLGVELIEACTRFSTTEKADIKKLIEGPKQDNVARFG